MTPAPADQHAFSTNPSATALTSPTDAVPAHLAARQAKVRAVMCLQGLDTLLLTHPGDLAYLSDFTGHDSIGVFTLDRFALVTDFRYTEQAAIECAWLPAILREGKMADALLASLIQTKSKQVGFEANFTMFGQVDSLRSAIQSAGKVIEIKPVVDLIVNVRKIKDAVEITTIEQAVQVAQQSLLAILGRLKPSISENHVAGLLLLEMRQRGASDASFEPIIAAGAASSLPHYRPSDKPIQTDTLLLIDYGARYHGYCSDITRTFGLGKVPAKLREIHKIVLDAQQAAITAMKPGVITREIDAIARGMIDKAGYGQYFGHGLGHGIGRDIHEQPTLRKQGEDEPLAPGMVVTVEPGIYLPGLGGVRIEDDVLITETGHRVLSSLERSLDACTLD